MLRDLGDSGMGYGDALLQSQLKELESCSRNPRSAC